MTQGVRLHYADDGPRDAPVLLFAGSLGATLAMWEPQLTLGGPFRLIRIDHRGHGGSPVPLGAYAMPDLAADVLALLDDLGLARVAFCGLSLGGMIGMYLGSEHPDRLSSLTLCCTSAHFPDRGPWDDRIAAVEAGGTEGVADAVVSRWFTPAWATAHPDVVKALRDQIANTPDAGYLGCCRAIAAWDHRDRLGAVAVPTLVIGGADDLSTPIDPHASTLADGIPGARFEVLAGAHLATIESAERATWLISEHATITTS
jgi:3-oxoadipate enol-lactonase